MKSKLYIASIVIASALVGCSLDQEPGGSIITEKQYQEMDGIAKGTISGIYPSLYAYGGEHDAFGQRAIDLYGDLCCGDVAMNSQRYGWFVSDEYANTYQRRAYFWSFYYNIIRLCNKTINGIEHNLPSLDFDPETITEEQYAAGYYYAQLLTLRGWAYAALQRYFCAIVTGEKLNTELSVPIYTEEITRTDSVLGAPRATAADVYLRVEEDLKMAIAYFTAFNKIERSSKLYVNIDVARTTLAYSYLNKGAYPEAIQQVEDLLGSTKAKVLPNAEVLTNGFNNVETSSWIWGEKVTVDNYTGLASFFGQCDIYSYSYASAGDVKGIDANLYKEIQKCGWDIREGWWNKYWNANPDEKNRDDYQYAPDGKFYSAKSTTLSGDRDWLSDNVFMRIELAYLIGAEAAYRNKDNGAALKYLRGITDERVKLTDDAKAVYSAYCDSIAANGAALGDAIRYNWRVELWGEGYGLQTFRRWGAEVELGDNHLRSEKKQSPEKNSYQYTFPLPSSETRYNPYIRSTTTLAEKS